MNFKEACNRSSYSNVSLPVYYNILNVPILTVVSVQRLQETEEVDEEEDEDIEVEIVEVEESEESVLMQDCCLQVCSLTNSQIW